MGLFYCFLVLVAVSNVHGDGDDKTTTAGGMSVRVAGASGKIRLWPTKGTIDNNATIIEMDAIYEIDENGNKIKGSNPHSFNNFASIGFTFSDIFEGKYNGSDGDLDVVYFNFSSDISVALQTAKLITYVYLFKEEGNITIDGQNETVYEGDLKFNIEIKDWPFCGSVVTCTSNGNNNPDLVGKYLDFDIAISGNGKTDVDSGMVGGARVITPKEVIYNGTTTKDMPDGYPNTTVSDSKVTYTFRFESFESVLYDPIVSQALTDDSSDGDGGSTTDESESISYSGVKAELKGSSGKILVSSGDNSVVVELDNLKEKKSDGGAITENGHSYNTFAGKGFTLQPVVEENYKDTDIPTMKISASRTMTNNAIVTLDLYVFKAAGNISNGDEYTLVTSGTVKFNLGISGWTFCDSTNTCKQSAMGEYLDIEIVMKGKNSKAKQTSSSNSTGDAYDLGGSTVFLSKKVYVDGATDPSNLPEGYPKLETKGSKEIFHFRFNKFTNKVLYDPTIELTGGGASGSSMTSASTLSLMIVILAAMLRMF